MRSMVAALLLIPCLALGADNEYLLVIRNHRFEPAEFHVPPGIKIKLMIDNQDDTAEEFESYPLNREKVVPAHSRLPIFIGPLSPGRYPFFGDFHQKTAQGAILVP
jgi:hypothetical protein